MVDDLPSLRRHVDFLPVTSALVTCSVHFFYFPTAGEAELTCWNAEPPALTKTRRCSPTAGSFPCDGKRVRVNVSDEKNNTKAIKHTRGTRREGVPHLATKTSRVVRYSESTRSSFLTISPRLRVGKVPLEKTDRHFIFNISFMVESCFCCSRIFGKLWTLTTVCTGSFANWSSRCCTLRCGILIPSPPGRLPEKREGVNATSRP